MRKHIYSASKRMIFLSDDCLSKWAEDWQKVSLFSSSSLNVLVRLTFLLRSCDMFVWSMNFVATRDYERLWNDDRETISLCDLASRWRFAFNLAAVTRTWKTSGISTTGRRCHSIGIYNNISLHSFIRGVSV